MSDNYNALDTTSVKVTSVDEVVQQEPEVVVVVEKVVAPALVVQRPVLYFLQRLVRPF